MSFLKTLERDIETTTLITAGNHDLKYYRKVLNQHNKYLSPAIGTA